MPYPFTMCPFNAVSFAPPTLLLALLRAETLLQRGNSLLMCPPSLAANYPPDAQPTIALRPFHHWFTIGLPSISTLCKQVSTVSSALPLFPFFPFSLFPFFPKQARASRLPYRHPASSNTTTTTSTPIAINACRFIFPLSHSDKFNNLILQRTISVKRIQLLKSPCNIQHKHRAD